MLYGFRVLTNGLILGIILLSGCRKACPLDVLLDGDESPSVSTQQNR
ncbi:hypothetical protein [Peribacillus simplex]